MNLKIRRCATCKEEDPKEGFSKSHPCYCRKCDRERTRNRKSAQQQREIKPVGQWVDNYKVCPNCKISKHRDDYYASKHIGWCKECQNYACSTRAKNDRPRYREYSRRMYKTVKGQVNMQNSHLRRQYGITLADKLEILAAQDNICPICRCSDPGPRGWVVDHCHRKGNIRAILCDRCNKMLGFARDNPSILSSAITYLLKDQVNRGPAEVTVGFRNPEEETE